jgi:diguanylate cyclase (GGDEF)-like protein
VDSDGKSAPAISAAVWAHLRPPVGLAAQTRWLFTVLAVASVLLSLPALVDVPVPGLRLAIAAAYVGLISVWSHRYLTGRAPVLLSMIEAVLVTIAMFCGPDPASVFSVVFASLWLRALYGSTAGIVAHTTFLAIAVMSALGLWTLMPGRVQPPPPLMSFLGAVPQMFLTAGVARYLGLSLFAREQAQKRDAALMRLGHRLIGLTDREDIRRQVFACTDAICAATPGLRLVTVLLSGNGAVVVDHAGDLPVVPAMLPTSILPIDPLGGVQPLPASGPLAAAAGADCTWLGVPMADDAPGWILIGAPRRVPPEAVVAIRSMNNQFALAMRTSGAYQDLATQASEDPLTGLANRAAFTLALEAAVADPSRPAALLFIDLDDFKIVNDGLGHSAGDELLRRVAARLRAGVRPDDLCARIGGDEFAVLLGADADVDAATVVAQRLVELLAAPVSLNGRPARVGASVGLAFAADTDTSGEQLVQRADVAMYAAKAKGKNRVQVFDPSLLREDGGAQFDIELAGAADAGQLVVHYQPIVLVDDERCVAVEALVRWQHPTRGLLPPVEFIAAAERTGAILGIGEHVLRRACADAAEWRGPAGPLAVHVNVSAAQLTEPGFVQTVRRCVAEFAMQPRQLVLEITEGMVLDSAVVRATLEAITVLGVALAIDDFGTGYSALSTLRSLPLDIVKIDKSFLAGGPSRAADEAVVEAVVQMARRLGLQVVAEGVERVEQQQFLRTVGAHAAQGYLHLRPTSAADFECWLGQQNAGRPAGGSVTPLGPRRVGPRAAGGGRD